PVVADEEQKLLVLANVVCVVAGRRLPEVRVRVLVRLPLRTQAHPGTHLGLDLGRQHPRAFLRKTSEELSEAFGAKRWLCVVLVILHLAPYVVNDVQPVSEVVEDTGGAVGSGVEQDKENAAVTQEKL